MVVECKRCFRVAIAPLVGPCVSVWALFVSRITRKCRRGSRSSWTPHLRPSPLLSGPVIITPDNADTLHC